jgi:hypothetical protein
MLFKSDWNDDPDREMPSAEGRAFSLDELRMSASVTRWDRP